MASWSGGAGPPPSRRKTSPRKRVIVTSRSRQVSEARKSGTRRGKGWLDDEQQQHYGLSRARPQARRRRADDRAPGGEPSLQRQRPVRHPYGVSRRQRGARRVD